MKFSQILVLGSFIFLASTSCKKELQAKTSGDQVVSELQKVITQNYIKRIYPVKYNDALPNSYPVEAGTNWQFSNGFIQVNYGFNASYNLLYLHEYLIHQVQLDDNTSEKALLLFF